MSRTLSYDIPASDLPCSLRAWLKKRGYSHRVLTDLMKAPENVTVANLPVKLSTFLTAPCTVTLRLPTGDPVPVSGLERLPDVPVLYEDEDVIVFVKPAGMPTHPVHGHQGDTLADFARESGGSFTFRPVGRLDRNTSGLLLVAKTSYAARAAATVEKTYLAVVEGDVPAAGTVDAPIRHKDGSQILREVGEGGDPAVTHYEPVARENGYTLLRLRLETGRTHQIRVHMAHLGFPLAGDDLYGGRRDGIARHALHCAALSFIHPVTGERLSFEAPMPEDMARLLTRP